MRRNKNKKNGEFVSSAKFVARRKRAPYIMQPIFIVLSLRGHSIKHVYYQIYVSIYIKTVVYRETSIYINFARK